MSTEHLMGVYNRAPLEVDRGQGARLWGKDGTEYLDRFQRFLGCVTTRYAHSRPASVTHGAGREISTPAS